MRQLAFLFTLFLISLTNLGFSQAVSHQYNLRYTTEDHVLKGTVSIEFKNNQTKPIDTLYLHLPSRSLSWEESALNQQLLEYQNIESYFASADELGSIDIERISLGNQSITEWCSACEFVYLVANKPINPNEAIQLQVEFTLTLPKARFNGIGYTKNGSVRVAEWLPKLSVLRNNQWYNYPYRLQNDVYPQANKIQVRLTLPATAELFSNLSPTTATDSLLLQKQDTTDLKNDSYVEGFSKTINLTAFAHDAQLFWSSNWFTQTMANGRRLATEDGDYAWTALTPKFSKKISGFLYNEGLDSLPSFDVLLLKDKVGEYQNEQHLIVLNTPSDAFELETDLVYALAQQKLRYALPVNGYKEAWIARGLPYFYKYYYIQQKFPQKAWLPFSFSYLGKFFDLDEFAHPYQNSFLYLYLARQNLDQEMATEVDSLTRLNYEAITEAKAYLSFNHLREYVGNLNFKRAMHRYYTQYVDSITASQQLQSAFEFYHNQPVSAFFTELPKNNKKYDFALVETDYCPTVATATVINRGTVMLPYSLTGYKNNQPVYTEWFQPHEGKKSVQLLHEAYDYVVLNEHLNQPEYSQKNNWVRSKGVFKQMEPLRLQFYNSFERPDRTQIFWLPTIAYNAYDKALIGVTLSNSSLVQKNFEYAVGPEFSTGTGSLTGYASFLYNRPIKSKSTLLRQWSTGLFTRYYHYDEDLSYFRVSPAVNFYFEDPHAYRKIRHRLRFRAVMVDRELPSVLDATQRSDIRFASYTVLNANYKLENISIIKPYTLKADFQIGDQFSRLDAEADIRYMLPNKKWFIWRNFVGYFFNSSKNDVDDPNFYSYGLSGTQDYLFDYSFIGRSDETGIWSRQFFVTDGGFKSETGIFSNNFMLTSNVSLPIYSFFGLFGDVGVVDEFETVYWDFGVRLAFLTDFVEVYFPMFSNNTNFTAQPNYFANTRFVLDVNISNIIARARRGYY